MEMSASVSNMMYRDKSTIVRIYVAMCWDFCSVLLHFLAKSQLTVVAAAKQTKFTGGCSPIALDYNISQSPLWRGWHRSDSPRNGLHNTGADMFGNFNLNAGLSQLQDLGGRFQKIKEDLEQNIESSLRTNTAPAASGTANDDSSAATTSADGSTAFGGICCAVC